VPDDLVCYLGDRSVGGVDAQVTEGRALQCFGLAQRVRHEVRSFTARRQTPPLLVR
jgi:hypothetical protein